MAKLIVGNSTATPIRVIKEEVQVVAPYSVRYTVDSNNTLQYYSESGNTTWPSFDLGNAIDLGYKIFKEASANISEIYINQIATIDLHKLTKITGNEALYNAFYRVELPSLTKIDLSNITEITGDSTCYQAFEQVHPSSIGQELIVDLSSLQTISGNKAGAWLVDDNYDIYTVSLPELTTIYGTSAATGMFAHCGSLETVSLESLTTIDGTTSATASGSNAAYNMFGGVITPGLTTTPTTNSILREVYLPSLQYVNGGSYMFSNNPNLTSVVLGSSDLVLRNSANMFQNCYSLNSIDFLDSVSEIHMYGAYYMFNNCTGLSGDIHIRNVKKIVENYACEYMFHKCNNITSITFDSLVSINNGSQDFIGLCGYSGNSLTDIYFPRLMSIFDSNVFLNMLSSNNTGVTLHFASNLSENEMFQQIINIVGGNETVVLFDMPETPSITINIPNNYNSASAFYDGSLYEMNWENKQIKIPLIDDNMDIYFEVDGHKFYKFSYNKDEHGLVFTLPEPEITSQLNISSTNANIYSCDFLVKTENGQIFSSVSMPEPIPTTYLQTACAFGPDVIIDMTLRSEDSGYPLPVSYEFLTDGYNTEVTISFQEAETILDLNSSNFYDYLTIGDEEKWFVEYAPDGSGDEILRIHQDQNINWQTMQSIQLTIPENINTIKVSGYANADSENNYDYGFIAIDDGSVTRTYQQIKNWSAGGELVFRDCGQNGYNLKYFEVDLDVSQLSQYDPLMLSIGYGQDNYLKGTNSFYIKNIKIVGF